jgi:hypothetical protein
MLKEIFQVTTYLLALYGFTVIVSNVVIALLKRANIKNSSVRLVLIVKNQENIIEGIVRSILMLDVLRKIMSRDRLIVVDMGSTDDTLNILSKLKNDGEYIEILKEGEKDMVFTGYEKSPPIRVIEIND